MSIIEDSGRREENRGVLRYGGEGIEGKGLWVYSECYLAIFEVS